ncbi:MAG TPA: hypothetical protein DEQ47_14580 [Solibacterales bacterium]|nr:hypothetical protein [Bryobacterales bacterium]
MTIKRSIFSLAVAVLLTVQGVPLRAAKKPVTDDAIVDSVKRKLATDATVKGGALDVDAKDGVVVLKGKVTAQKQKDKAERIARKVNGVKSVDNQLQVGPR